MSCDLRPDSQTRACFSIVPLSRDGVGQLFVPKGFAHGFVTLEPNTIVHYKVDAPYDPSSEGGIHWDDRGLAIPWPLRDAVKVSDKDDCLPGLEVALADWENG